MIFYKVQQTHLLGSLMSALVNQAVFMMLVSYVWAACTALEGLPFFVSLKTHQTTKSSLDSISAHCIPISHKKKCSNLFANTTANTIILTHQSPHPLLGTLIVNTSLKPSSGHQNGSRLLGHLNGPFEFPPTRTRLAARVCYQKASRRGTLITKKLFEIQATDIAKKILPFVTTYNPGVPKLKEILMKNWLLITNNLNLAGTFPNALIVAVRKDKSWSLKDLLVRAKISPQP